MEKVGIKIMSRFRFRCMSEQNKSRSRNLFPRKNGFQGHRSQKYAPDKKQLIIFFVFSVGSTDETLVGFEILELPVRIPFGIQTGKGKI